MLDPRHRSVALPASSRGTTPRTALEAAVLRGLLRPPCIVSFSGGRDSSAVLAAAAHVARREGLPLPVPVTNRFRHAPGAGEAPWQEAVVAHLGLDDWVRLEHGSELDVVGPVARRMLRRHGLLWPCNAHFHVPILATAAGGTVLTGIGGDEALSPSALARLSDVVRGRVRPQPRDALRLGLAAAPHRLRTAVHARRLQPLCPWLRPPAQAALRRALASEAATEPYGWRARFGWLAGDRAARVGTESLAVLAADAGVAIDHPLRDPHVLAALGALPASQRFTSRVDAMELLVGDLVPPDVRGRRGKAAFDEAFWSSHSRALAARWGGEGVDAALVDHDRLRAEWTSDRPDARSFLLLQAAWLAQAGRQPVSSSSSRLPAGSIDAHPGGRDNRQAGSVA